MELPSTPAASRPTVQTMLRSARRMATRAVISFVVEAMRIRASAFWL